MCLADRLLLSVWGISLQLDGDVISMMSAQSEDVTQLESLCLDEWSVKKHQEPHIRLPLALVRRCIVSVPV